ncbi:hypothetical protein CDD83_10362 [Cordyceps sp. RAO-2017]|nr:hypothetical protein CDD83_10362 [Cordyceps sp. RAO-2017]
MTAAGGDSTDCQSAGATLSAGAQSVRTEQDEADLSGDTQAEGTRESQSESDPDRLSDADEAGEYPLEPHDDVPLKGPLMIRNIPAQDELFFARLDRKLESVVSGQDSVPSVLRAASPDPGAARAPPAVAAQPRQPAPSPPVGGGDASQDTGSTPENEETDLDPEVPLRLKTTSNFGAPFGEA